MKQDTSEKRNLSMLQYKYNDWNIKVCSERQSSKNLFYIILKKQQIAPCDKTIEETFDLSKKIRNTIRQWIRTLPNYNIASSITVFDLSDYWYEGKTTSIHGQIYLKRNTDIETDETIPRRYLKLLHNDIKQDLDKLLDIIDILLT